MTHAASRAPEPSRAPSSIPGFTLQEGIWFGDFDDEEARRVAAASLTAMGGRIMGARPIPAAAQKLVQLTRDEDADIHKVVRVLEMDPGLSQKILRLVNSAGYGLRIRCTSLQHATALLGQVKLRQVATSAVLFDHFGKASPLTRKKQEHGAVVASLCRYLAIHLGLPQDDLFTIGLLHDIGELMMLDDDLKGYPQLLAETEGQFDVLHIRERELYGFDHAALAAHVLASWSIPSPLPDVIALHHQPAVAHQHSLDVAAMVQTLRFADHMAHLLDQKNPRRSIATLAESEAASYLDFSEVQIAAMWRDLEKVQEVTKNRRLNIMDMAPRTVSVPDSLRPRGVPFSARPPEDRGSKSSDGTASQKLPEQIAVPSFRSPLALLRHVPEAPEARAHDAEPQTGDQERTAHGAEHHSPTEEAAETPPRHQQGPVLSPLSTRRIEVPTFSVQPPAAQPHEPPQRLNPPAFEEEPPRARVSEEDPVTPPEKPHPIIRPIFDGAHTDEALLARLTGGALEHEESEHPEPERQPEAGRRIEEAPERQQKPRAPEADRLVSAEKQEADSPWFEQAANDVNPEVFPCAFCYAPTFGASCSVCGAQTCPEHQLTSRQWCVACEEEFQTFLQSHGTSPMVPLSVGVTLAIAFLATWYFASIDGALGVLSIGIVLIFGLFVSHHVSLKRRFRIARKRALEEMEEAELPSPVQVRAEPDDDPLSRTLEAIAEEEVTRGSDDVDPEGSPLSMPVPAPRAHGFVIAPICEPPRPSLLNFHRPEEHVPMFESLMAPGAEPEPPASPIKIVGAPVSPKPEAAEQKPLPGGGVTPTWPAPSDEPKAPVDAIAAVEAQVPGASFPETPRSLEVLSAPEYRTEPDSESESARAPENTRRGVAPPGDPVDSRVEPLERSLRSIMPATEATEEEIFAVGYSAPQCNPGAPSAAIIVPELQSVQDYCFGVPQNTVSIEAARSA